jgi:hypothetical protein
MASPFAYVGIAVLGDPVLGVSVLHGIVAAIDRIPAHFRLGGEVKKAYVGASVLGTVVLGASVLRMACSSVTARISSCVARHTKTALNGKAYEGGSGSAVGVGDVGLSVAGLSELGAAELGVSVLHPQTPQFATAFGTACSRSAGTFPAHRAGPQLCSECTSCAVREQHSVQVAPPSLMRSATPSRRGYGPSRGSDG